MHVFDDGFDETFFMRRKVIRGGGNLSSNLL
jgi:hypothetical protein